MTKDDAVVSVRLNLVGSFEVVGDSATEGRSQTNNPTVQTICDPDYEAVSEAHSAASNYANRLWQAYQLQTIEKNTNCKSDHVNPARRDTGEVNLAPMGLATLTPLSVYWVYFFSNLAWAVVCGVVTAVLLTIALYKGLALNGQFGTYSDRVVVYRWLPNWLSFVGYATLTLPNVRSENLDVLTVLLKFYCYLVVQLVASVFYVSQYSARADQPLCNSETLTRYEGKVIARSMAWLETCKNFKNVQKSEDQLDKSFAVYAAVSFNVLGLVVLLRGPLLYLLLTLLILCGLQIWWLHALHRWRDVVGAVGPTFSEGPVILSIALSGLFLFCMHLKFNLEQDHNEGSIADRLESFDEENSLLELFMSEIEYGANWHDFRLFCLQLGLIVGTSLLPFGAAWIYKRRIGVSLYENAFGYSGSGAPPFIVVDQVKQEIRLKHVRAWPKGHRNMRIDLSVIDDSDEETVWSSFWVRSRYRNAPSYDHSIIFQGKKYYIFDVNSTLKTWGIRISNFFEGNGVSESRGSERCRYGISALTGEELSSDTPCLTIDRFQILEAQVPPVVPGSLRRKFPEAFYDDNSKGDDFP